MALSNFLHVESDCRYRAVTLKALFSPGSCHSTTRPNLLDCELSALKTYRQHHVKKHDREGRDGLLTARTLKRDVLPAFWRPIIVTSISVALIT